MEKGKTISKGDRKEESKWLKQEQRKCATSLIGEEETGSD